MPDAKHFTRLFVALTATTALVVGVRGATRSSYFPKALFSRSEAADRSWAEEIKSVLIRMHEPPLYKSQSQVQSRTYRLLLLRSAKSAACVRLQIEADGTAIVSTAELLPNTHKASVTRRKQVLDSARARTFEAIIDKGGFWDLPALPGTPDTGPDGSVWLIEGKRDNEYHAVRRWMPGGPMRDIGSALASLGSLPDYWTR